jgi:hypothetical protein
MRKKFALNLLFLLAANLLVKPFWIFGIDRVVQNKVGPAGVRHLLRGISTSLLLLALYSTLGLTTLTTEPYFAQQKSAWRIPLQLGVA